MEEEGHLLLVVEPQSDLTDEQVFNQVQQEFDRIDFLTGVYLSPKPDRKENPNGSIQAISSIAVFLHGIKPLPAEIDRQDWDKSLPVQLRLWKLAHSPNLPLSSQINLLFQIIEISYPNTDDEKDFPPYLDSKKSPEPPTEAKLLRHLASHGKQKMKRSKQVQRYCKYLAIPEESHDPTDFKFLQVLRDGLPIVENEARKVINEAITRKPREAYKEIDL